MSGVLKGIGKVFKKVVKVVKKVAIPALAIGAIVLTGGAALGLLPAVGTLVGGLGLSAGLTTVLTGAITTGAIGAGAGLLTGGIKGMSKGFLMGAATGGIMAGAGLMGPAGAFGLDGTPASATAASGAAGVGGAGSAVGGLVQNSALAQAITNPLPSVFQGAAGMSVPSVLGGSAAAGVGGTISSLAGAGSALLPTAAAGAGAAAAGGGLLSNPLLMSQLLGGVSQAFAPNEYKQRFNAEQDAAERNSYFAYGGGDPDGKKKKFGMIQGVYSSRANPFGTADYGTPPQIQTPYQPRKTRWAWDPSTNSVVEQGAG